MITFHTESQAVYELDTSRHRIRRIEPGSGAVRRIGKDWVQYDRLVAPPALGNRVILWWPDGTYTATTPVWMLIEPAN